MLISPDGCGTLASIKGLIKTEAEWVGLIDLFLRATTGADESPA